MSERDMYADTMRPGLLRLGFSLMRVENRAMPGTPDVNWYHGGTRREGWLELKWMRKWPENEDTEVKIKHFTQEQKLWLLDRSSMGARADMLICVEGDWLLIPGWWAAKEVGQCTQGAMRENAAVVSSGGFDAMAIALGILRA